MDLRSYDRNRVAIVGTLYDFAELPNDEDTPVLRDKLLDGVTIPNFCFGEKVLLLRSIRYARD